MIEKHLPIKILLLGYWSSATVILKKPSEDKFD